MNAKDTAVVQTLIDRIQEHIATETVFIVKPHRVAIADLATAALQRRDEYQALVRALSGFVS